MLLAFEWEFKPGQHGSLSHYLSLVFPKASFDNKSFASFSTVIFVMSLYCLCCKTSVVGEPEMQIAQQLVKCHS